MEITYDDKNLQRLFAEMDVKKRMMVLKGAFRRNANNVRKAVINNLRVSGFKSDQKQEKYVRPVVFRRTAGFTVTLRQRKGKGKKSESASYGQHKKAKKIEPNLPLIWAEAGTSMRRTKTKTRIWTRSRKSHPTGRIKRYGFMYKTRKEVADKVTEDLHNEIINSITKVAKKYGCT